MNPELWKLLAKVRLDRRRGTGGSEFSFRLKRDAEGWHRIRVTGKQGAFDATVMLRRGNSDLRVFEQVFVDNDYNLRRLRRWDEICRLYEQLAAAGTPLILDLGANIGLASLYFAKNWPLARIVAVEPDARNYDAIRRNVAAYPMITPVRAAAASEDGAVKIANPDSDAWTFRTVAVAADSQEAIPALSVDSLIARFGPLSEGHRPFIAKIDIEGFEADLFAQNVAWIARFPVIIIELHDWMLPRQGTANNFLRAIAQHNRDFIHIGENVFSIANDFPAEGAVVSSASQTAKA